MDRTQQKNEYINILLGEIKTTQALSNTTQGMSRSVQEIYYHPDLYAKLLDQNQSLADRLRLLDQYLAGVEELPLICRNFLQMLFRREQFFLLDDQDKPTFLYLMHDKIAQISSITITVHDYLSDYLTNWIHEALSELVNYDFVLEIEVDPGILGGIVIQSDSIYFDDTIVSRLQLMNQAVKDRIHQLTVDQLDSAIDEAFGPLRKADQAGGVS